MAGGRMAAFSQKKRGKKSGGKGKAKILIDAVFHKEIVRFDRWKEMMTQ